MLKARSPNHWTAREFPVFVFYDLDTLEGNWSVLWRIFPNMSLFDVFSNETEVMDFGKEYHRGDVPSSVHSVRGCVYMMLRCLITGDVNLDHLVRWRLPVCFCTVK